MNTQLSSARTSPGCERNTRAALPVWQLPVDSRVRLMMVTKSCPPAGAAVFFLIGGAAAQVPLPTEPDALKAKCGSQVRSTYCWGLMTSWRFPGLN